MSPKNADLNTRRRFVLRLANWTLKNRWPVLLGSILLALALGYGGQNLGFNSDYRIFFSEENPQLQAFDALQEKYTKDDNVLIVIEPNNGEVFTNETLTAIEELTEKAWQTPYSSRVDAITNFQHTRAVEDDLYVSDLVENAWEKSPSELEEIKAIAINEPLLRHRLIDPEGTITAVNITLKFPGEKANEEDEVIAYVRELATEIEAAYPNLETYSSGVVMLTGAFKEAAQKDMGTLVPLMFGIIIFTIFIATRSFSSTFATLVVIILSIMTAMGFAGWMGLDLTAPSASAPTIIMTLAIADSIHVLITLIQNMRNGMAKQEAIIESIRVNFMPIFITSLTTVIGFLTMNFSDAPPFRDLGNITAVGMTAAFLFSLFTLPALVSLLPLRVKIRENNNTQSGGLLGRFADWVILHNKRLLWGASFVIVGVSIFAVRNEMNDEFVKYFSEDITFRSDTDYVGERLTGIYNVEFSLGAGESGGINNPDYLAKLEEFEQWLYDQEEVIHVNTFSEVSKRINKSMHGDEPSYYRVPDQREEAAQFLLLYEMSLPFGLDLNNQINVDKSETRYTVTLENVSSKDLIAFNTKAENWLAEHTPESMFANGTSTATMFSHLGKRQMKSMISGTALGIFLITIILMLALRSFEFGALSLIPNVTPITVGFGVWALTVGSVNTGVAIVFGMTLGIIVDDTVHFISKYLRARREHGKSPEDAVRYAFATVGQALVVTTAVLIAGFAILAQSQFGMNAGMAKVTVIIIGLALLIDFTLLPAALILRGKRRTRQTQMNLAKPISNAKVEELSHHSS